MVFVVGGESHLKSKKILFGLYRHGYQVDGTPQCPSFQVCQSLFTGIEHSLGEEIFLVFIFLECYMNHNLGRDWNKSVRLARKVSSIQKECKENGTKAKKDKRFQKAVRAYFLSVKETLAVKH